MAGEDGASFQVGLFLQFRVLLGLFLQFTFIFLVMNKHLPTVLVNDKTHVTNLIERADPLGDKDYYLSGCCYTRTN